MKKTAFTFLLAVLAPSLALGWLALRSLEDQQLVADRQQTLLFQAAVDRLAAGMNEALLDHRRQFAREVEQLLAPTPAPEVPGAFHSMLTTNWPLAEVGFVVSLDGQVVAPSVFEGTKAREFRVANDRFLCSKESVEVYYNTPKGAISLSLLDRKEQAGSGITPGAMDGTRHDLKDESTSSKLSKWSVAETEFHQLIQGQPEGTLARFLQDRLHVMFWYRSPQRTGLVFGSQIHLGLLLDGIKSLVHVPRELEGAVAVALLDDRSRPLTIAPANFETDWKKPSAAADVSESLPHWQVTAYALNPGALPASARTTRWTLILLTALLLLAIAAGSGLIVLDVRRELALARQKTDFVSNVSHELKTPLTSIRMFSELLAERKNLPAEKRQSYLAIIASETVRLTRLINNVLDFARIDRGERQYQFHDADLSQIARSAVESCRPALEQSGFTVEFLSPPEPVPARVDRDAIAQLLLNLLSNAEKYSDDRKSIRVEVLPAAEHAEVRVLDRGIGVPPGCAEKIFDQFFRAHDSLANSVQGSGLGLTLARHIARAHGGGLTCEPRDGGGTAFILRLPTVPAHENANPDH